MTDLEHFVAESNVTHFRKLLEQEVSPERREILTKLLKQAEVTLNNINFPQSCFGKAGDRI